MPTATASTGLPPLREWCRNRPSICPPPRSASAIAGRFASGTSPRILPTSLVSKIRAQACREAATAPSTLIRRLNNTCMTANAGETGSNSRAPAICPSRLAAKVRQPRVLQEYSTYSSAVLGEKSSHSTRRCRSTQLHTIGQAQEGKGSWIVISCIQ